MPRTRKPSFSRWARIAPDFPADTESGLRIVSVRSNPISSSISEFAGLGRQPVDRLDAGMRKGGEQLARLLRADHERGTVGAGEKDALVPARVQSPPSSESPDSPASILPDRTIDNGFGGADLRQRDAGPVEEAELHDDRVRLDPRRLVEGQQRGHEQEDSADEEVDPRREPLLFFEERGTVHRCNAVFTVAPRSAGDLTTMQP